MKLSCKLSGVALFTLMALMAQQATALSEDDKTMGSASASARFSDPDDQTPSVLNLQGSASAGNGAVDPSTIRYDYDAASGSYVPHKN